jgi:uncharacterized delta-60 repeat protein
LMTPVRSIFVLAAAIAGVAQAATPPVITTQPTNQTVGAGISVQLRVLATADPPPEYQWFFNEVPLATRTNTFLTLFQTQTTNQGDYFATASNAVGVITSQTARLTVITNAPEIIAHPTNVAVVAGQTAQFSVMATGLPPPRYQWRFEGQDMPGRTSSSLSFGAQQTNAGGYSVVVSNSAGMVTSQVAFLTVSADAYISVNPTNTSLIEGQDLRLQSGGFGRQPLSRQWYYNGTVLADATNDLLRLRSIRLSSAGDYYFVLSNYLGAVTSAVATVSITPASRQPGAVDIDYYTGTNDVSDIHIMAFDSQQRILAANEGAVVRVGHDGRSDATFPPTSGGGRIYALGVQSDDKIVLGGQAFPGGRNMTRLNANGTTDTNFVPPIVSSDTRGLTILSDGRIVFAGVVSSANGTDLTPVRALTAEGMLDASYLTILSAPPGGAEPPTYPPDYRQIFLRNANDDVLFLDKSRYFRTHSDGSFDTSFIGSAQQALVAELTDDGTLFVGGTSFYTGRYLARFDARGQLDPSFQMDPAITNRIRVIADVAIQSDGRVVVAAVAQQGSNFVFRLQANGQIDSTFAECQFVGTPRALLIQKDGGIIMGGNFTTFRGYARHGLVRLYGDPPAAPLIVRQPQNLTVVEGQQGGLFVDVSVTAITSYQWFQGTEPVAGETNRLLRFRRAAVAQSGDYVLVASNAFGLTTSSVARVTVTTAPFSPGYVDLSWNVDCNAAINAVVRAPDGKFLIGGRFTRVADRPRNSVVRLHTDGSLDESFDPATNAAHISVERLALTADGKVLAGGIGGLVRLNTDGSRDSAFQSAWSQQVRAVASLPDGKVMVGGDSAPVWRLNADGSRDTGFFTPLSYIGPNYDLVVQPDDKILVSTPTYSVLRLQTNGAVDTSFSTEHFLNHSPYSIHLRPEGDLVVGGRAPFSAYGFVVHLGADGRKACATGPCIFDIRSGVVNWVSSDACGRILVGGRFASIPSNSPPHFARLQFNGQPDAEFTIPSLNGAVLTGLALPDGRILIAGEFTSVAGVPRHRIAILHGGPFSPPVIATQPEPQTTSEGHGLTLSATVPCVEPAAHLQWFLNGVALAGETNPTLRVANALRSDAGPYTLVLSNALGVVTSATAQVTVNHAPHVLGAPFVEIPSLLPSNSVVNALLLLPDGRLLVGGSFSNFLGLKHAGLLRLNADGSLDQGFVHQQTNTIRTLALQRDGRIVAVEQTPAFEAYLFRLWPNGARDTNFGNWPRSAYFLGTDTRLNIPVAVNYFERIYVGQSGLISIPQDSAGIPVNGNVQAMAFQPDHKLLVGGTFSGIRGVTRTNLGRVLPNGVPDPTFRPEAGAIYCLALQGDGKVVVGGQFTRAGSIITRGLARFNADGSVDATFAPSPGISGVSAAVHALLVQPDGKIVIAGPFTHYNGVTRNNLARVNADGSLDETFQPGSGITGGTSRVAALAMTTDATLYLGGSFTHFDGVPRQSFAAAYNNPRLYNLQRSGDRVTVPFLSLVDRTYIFEFKQHWDDPVWTTIVTVDGDGTVQEVSDTNLVNTSRFYRLRVE